MEDLEAVRIKTEDSHSDVEADAVQPCPSGSQALQYLIIEEFPEGDKCAELVAHGSQSTDDQQTKARILDEYSENSESQANTAKTKRRRFSCELCSKTFAYKKGLQKHLTIHVKGRKPEFACHPCEKNFLTSGGLRAHMRLHTGDTYDCDLCESRFPEKARLQRHKEQRHRTGTPFKCKLCDIFFPTALDRDGHTCDPHSYRYKCSLCDKRFATHDKLTGHVWRHTSRPWRCGICKRRISSRSRLQIHIMGIHKIKEPVDEFIQKVQNDPEDCSMEVQTLKPVETEVDDSDDAAFTPFPQTHESIKTELILDEEHAGDKQNSNSNSRNRRWREIVDGQYSCANRLSHEGSKVSKSSPKDLKEKHTSEIHVERPYQCKLCPLSFKLKTVLKTHQVTHIKDRKREFECDLCEKAFYSRSGFQSHMKLHTGDTHNCKICSARFPEVRDLKRHYIRCHPSETPYRCECCKKFFKTKTELNEHECKLQHLRFKCELCGTIYISKYALEDHKAEHTGLPWKCGVCEKKFASRARCRMHIIRVHKITENDEAHKHIQKIPTVKDL